MQIPAETPVPQWLVRDLAQHREVVAQMDALLPVVLQATQLCVDALKAGHKILLCGNGGSAADAQHIAAELVGRFQTERRGLAGIALTTDTSALTAIGNDYGYDQVFARQVEALARTGDVLVAYSTSGNSRNVILAVQRARELGCHVLCLLGRDGGALREMGDVAVIIPAPLTVQIQEMHLMVGHMICHGIDEAFNQSVQP
jgi:D-sedoheptulose 7-phosphate isomerase